MSLADNLHGDAQTLVLLAPLTITTALTAVTTTAVSRLAGSYTLIVECKFVYGSGGTSADVYVQTTLDGGISWFDIMNFHFLVASKTQAMQVGMYAAVATPADLVDGALAANTSLSGVLGNKLRLKYTTVGTYATTTTLAVYGSVKG